jgi:hypothetical protein
VAMILLRVLRADLRRYNAQRDDEGNDVLEVLAKARPLR